MIIPWGPPAEVLLIITMVMGSACLPLIPGLCLAHWARRQILKGQREVGDSTGEVTISGSQLAETLLETSGMKDWTILRTRGPLATFSDATLKQLRLSERVADGTSPLALGLAAHEFGHLLQDARSPAITAIRTIGVFGGRLGCGTAWLILLSTFLMLNPLLCNTAAWLYSASVFALLALQPLERDANRRCLAALKGMDSPTANYTSENNLPLLRALNSAVWVEIATTFPDPLGYWAKRHAPLG